MNDFEQTNWWKYLEEPMRDLVKESFLLIEREENSGISHHDYSFVVFPMAKAFEGFLKKMFLDLGIISVQQYRGDHFRIGKSLNPHLPKRYRSGWVYGKLVGLCRGEALPTRMWEMWKKGRNRIFHFFPDHQEFITLPVAKGLVMEMTEMMEEALVGCDVKMVGQVNETG